MSEEEKRSRFEAGRALEFGHSLSDLIGGQLKVGFMLTGFEESGFPGKAVDVYMPMLFATRALKPH